MTVEVAEVRNWDYLSVPDVYFSHEYHVASTNLEVEGTNPLLIELRKEGGVLRLPLLIRPIGGGLWDATSCYGYGGPWWEGESEPTGVRAALDDWARDRGVVCTFLRFHPLFAPRDATARIFDVLPLNETVEWPLAPGIDLLAAMKKKHRQYTRKSERAGLTSTVAVNPEDLSEFVALYQNSMDRLSASEFYRFPDEYWGAIAGSTGCDTLLCNVSLDGETVASLLCLVGEIYIHAHLLGTSEAGRDMKANYLAYVAAARWGQEHQKVGFHLGGGHGSDGGDLLAWKRGFCPNAELRQFSIAKVVHDLEAYRRLAGTGSTEGFFPPWRHM